MAVFESGSKSNTSLRVKVVARSLRVIRSLLVAIVSFDLPEVVWKMDAGHLPRSRFDLKVPWPYPIFLLFLLFTITVWYILGIAISYIFLLTRATEVRLLNSSLSLGGCSGSNRGVHSVISVFELVCFQVEVVDDLLTRSLCCHISITTNMAEGVTDIFKLVIAMVLG